MLAARIIPMMLCKGAMLVKGTRFNPWRICGSLENAVRVHATRGVDEMLLIDVTARDRGKLFDLEMLRRLTDNVFVPLTVGGGVAGVNDARDLLLHGADKVAIGPLGFAAIAPVAHQYGSQAVVAMVDYDDKFLVDVGPHLGIPVLEYCQMVVEQGAGEIVLQSTSRDGTMDGYDLVTCRQVNVPVPVIIAGGCASYNDMHLALDTGAIAGVAAGAMFQFTDRTPKGAAEWLQHAGFEVRL
jgi:imidazole glycerol-phosphate synthase subunit HisF